MTVRRLGTGLALLVGLAACSTGGGAIPGEPSGSAPASATQSPAVTPSGMSQAVELTVYAAASLKGALDAVRTAYAAVAPGVTLTIATDSSATLRTQIEQGAPADVLLSADEANPAKLVDAGLADGAAVPFAGNTLVVIVPAANPAAIATPADLAGDGVKIVAAGTEVPITKYATRVIANLENQPDYPARFAAAYDANVVSREDNVKAVVAKVELGEGDAAIVYATDAKASSKVRRVDIPPAANVPAIYAGVVVKASERRGPAHAFLDWLTGPDGQAALAGFGFVPPP